MFHKYLNPQNDLAFKKIFGQEKHKNIPIAFLNGVLNLTGDDVIVDLEFITTIQAPEIEARKESVVDVLVKDQAGCRYIIEMQVAKVEGFEKRAQYYAAKTYCAHFNSGDDYTDLKKVLFLAFTTYTLFPNKSEHRSDHLLFDTKTFDHDLKDFYFIFFDLHKFNKQPSELVTIEDKWCYFLKHAVDTDDINPILAANPEIKEAYAVLERTRWSERELLAYDRAAMAIADARGRLIAARKDGLKEGREQGLQEGRQEGLQEGRQEGLQEGVEKQKLETAIKMLQKKYTPEEVRELTGVDLEKLLQLKIPENTPSQS